MTKTSRRTNFAQHRKQLFAKIDNSLEKNNANNLGQYIFESIDCALMPLTAISAADNSIAKEKVRRYLWLNLFYEAYIPSSVFNDNLANKEISIIKIPANLKIISDKIRSQI